MGSKVENKRLSECKISQTLVKLSVFAVFGSKSSAHLGSANVHGAGVAGFSAFIVQADLQGLGELAVELEVPQVVSAVLQPFEHVIGYGGVGRARVLNF